MTAITIDTDQYRNSHAKAPKGYGLWMFSLGRQGAWTETQYTGGYASAKAQALREAKSLDCDTICVLP